MKKLLGIVVLGLLLCANVLANGSGLKNTLLNSELVLKYTDGSIHKIKFYSSGNAEWKTGKRSFDVVWNVIDDMTLSIYNPKLLKGKSPPIANIDFNNLTFTIDQLNGKSMSYKILSPKQFASGTQPTKNEMKNNEIMFTIKDKREQCEAIGFTPKTEKFADCVLRLVELDVKQKQSNKIAQAQQSGNDALVKQLQRQQYDRDTDALLSLGQQLLNPGTTNSNIYMPQTQRCTIQGFGTFAKMVCR